MKIENAAKLVIAGLLLGLLGYAVGRYVQPAKVVTKVEEKVKTVLVETTKKKKIKVRIVKPDGTIEERETEEDITVVEKEKVKEVEKEKLVESQKTQWKASLFAGSRSGESLVTPMYGVIVEKRFMGPVFLGGWATDQKDFGVSVGLEF